MNQEAYRINPGLGLQKRHKIATTLVRLLAYLLAASCAVAQTGKLSAEKQARIESAISKFMAASKTPGISAAVVQDGEFVWSAGFGLADLENSVPATSQTLYRLGSISKPTTATTAMKLYNESKQHVIECLGGKVHQVTRLYSPGVEATVSASLCFSISNPVPRIRPSMVHQ